MTIHKKYIRQLIEEEVNRLLREQDLPDENLPATTTPDSADNAEVEAPAADELPSGEDIDPNSDTGLDSENLGGDVNVPGTEGEIGDAGDMGIDSEEEGLGGDAGGGFGGFTGGGGFSFGSEGTEAGLNPEDDEESATAATVGPEDVEMPDDPVMSIVNDAIAMLQVTREPGVILKSIKSLMQKYYSDFDDATPVIKALWDTEDVALRDVARRLLLFIRGI